MNAGKAGQPVVIENPVINSPFEEPRRHFEFDDDGITDQIISARRPSSYFIPIAKPRKKSSDTQQTFEDWTADRIEENKNVNRIRQRVKLWREGKYPDITRTTARLLEQWNNPDRHRRLFFCQIEAMETLIYITEVARKYGDNWIENELRQFNDDANPQLFRIACKMATGSGKTAVMSMIIAWHTLNKLANPQDARFTDTFLVVTPGITIKDRLRVLLPGDPQNYYKGLEVVPSDLLNELGKAKILITNYHTFLRREKIAAGKLTKAILKEGEESAFTESEGEMVRRVCRELGNKKNIIVLNDEAHHCYRRRAAGDEPKLIGDERKEAEKREEEARIWISGLEAVKRKMGIKTVYDLSATPFFLRGSGYSEGTLFPWVVSDFSLIDAIESGIVKVPRVPVADNAMEGPAPTYRDLWIRIREDLPKKGRGSAQYTGEPRLPVELEGALTSLYKNYEKSYRLWERTAQASGTTPPVFIIVCNNTNVSKMVFDYVAGWEKTLEGGALVAVPGKLDLFSNVQGGHFLDRPNTILVDSEQIDSGEAMSDEFRKIAAREIDEFKEDLRQRFPGRDVEEITDEDLLREVMNTVGKAGKLGEQVKCVVSVSMLTEGWDANTVTHILGVRAFGTQLLCEQVVGRGLRRMSYAPVASRIDTPQGPVEFEAFDTEYAEVYGVPFSFIPASGAIKEKPPGPPPTHVRALEERIACEITFPRIDGYRYDLPAERLTARFTEKSHLALSTRDLPTSVENRPIVGQTSIHTLDDLKNEREQKVAFHIARRILEHYFQKDEYAKKPWLFPDLLEISRRWLSECVTCKDGTFKQLLLFVEHCQTAADKVYRAVVEADSGPKRLLPIPKPYDTIGSTRYVSFDTVKPTFKTRDDKSHVSHVVGDTENWEQKMAQTLEEMDEVVHYVKNHNVGFFIPYTVDGRQRSYYPDFIAHVDDGRGKDDLLNLIVEVSGARDKEKEAKVDTAKTLWVPAVNNAGTWGRWAYIEIGDPWDAAGTIRAMLSKLGKIKV
ncbi:MAG TPA: DEAD/DEAH box helicase family protein [Humisphaera sp.]|jgi:type III restriction enzyme|nr:DEAD/DEAH box helicase family protein [Humisphaera sp.]